MPALTVHNAEIKTAAVEIRTLTISGKQVTLAVFRQLKNEQLVSPEGTFVGLPWGVINYHPDKCADDSHHVHVVWQSGIELRRARVKEPRFPDSVFTESGADWLDAALLDGWRSNADVNRYQQRAPAEVTVRFEAGLAEIDTDRAGVSEALWPWVSHRYNATDEEKSAAVERARQEHLETIRARSADLSRERLSTAVNAEVAAELARRERHHARWSEVLALPQLFIAV